MSTYAESDSELKFFDTDIDDTIVATGGVVFPSINLIPQGVTESQRVGRMCTIQSIHWRYLCDQPRRDAQGVPALNDAIRVIMFVDKQANGAAAPAAQILDDLVIHGFRNLSNQGRFVFLLDKVIDLHYLTLASDNAGVVSQGDTTDEFTFKYNGPIPIEFNSTAGVIAEVRSNNIGVLLVSRTGTAGFSSKVRVRFSDR